MEYRQWLAMFKDLRFRYSTGQIEETPARLEIDELRSAIGQLPDEWVQYARELLVRLENMTTPEAHERLWRAHQAYVRGVNAEGSDAERIEMARDAIRQLAAIADETDDESEKTRLTGETESLSELIYAIEAGVG